MQRFGSKLVTALSLSGFVLLSACVIEQRSGPPVGEQDYGYYDEQSPDVDDASIYYEDMGGSNDSYDWYFRAKLHRWGEWILVPGYGYVWRPWVVGGWMPYSVGFWAWTEGGWFWVSYEPFGDIVYHYGNWAFLPGHGWCWFPSHEWRPHHVHWIEWESNVGWTPIPPRGIGHVESNWQHFVWISNRNFLERDLSRHILGSPGKRWTGQEAKPHADQPDRSAVESWTKGKVPMVQTDPRKHGTKHGDVQIMVPDRNTREHVQKDGPKASSRWLDPKKHDKTSDKH